MIADTKQRAEGSGKAATSARAPARVADSGGTSGGDVRMLRGTAGERRVTPVQALQMQRVVGNQAALRRLEAPQVGGALRVGPADGAVEREADRAAELAVRAFSAAGRAGEAEPPPLRGGSAFVACRHERAGGEAVVPDAIAGGIARARGGGRPLAAAVRGPMERAYGVDLGAVRIHTGAQADGLSRSLAARAFTSGADVFFRDGAYDPASRGGQNLLAHELAHVVQHGGGSPVIHRRAVGELPFAGGYDKIVRHPDWPAEAEAYEQRLGTYCYQHPTARRAADAALRRMQQVLADYFKILGKTDGDIAEAFLKDDTTSAGQMGTGDAVNKLTVLFERGNLRERMTAFYNAAYYKAGYSKDAGISLKTILHDLTIDSPTFDERSSRALGLDTEGLRSQSEFLRGKTRSGIHGALARFKPDKKYTVDRDIFALGNLYYQHSSGWKQPYGALREMVGSQGSRVDRSRADKATGRHKKTPKDYADMLAPLSDRERGFLAEQGKPLVMSEHAIDPEHVVGTHADPDGHSVTLDRRGDPHWEEEQSERLPGTVHTAWRIHRTRDEARGTAQEVEIRYAFAGQEPVLDADGAPKIAQITFKQIIVDPSRTRLEDGQQGPELPLDWIEGSAWFTFKDQPGGWVEKMRDQLGMPVVAGVSGTTTRMLRAFQWLNVPATSLEFRLAVMGWMLTSWDHSLYEILSGSRYAGVEGGTERLDNAPQMYQNIPPLTPEELRAGVCKDRMFPHERIYMKMARTRDDPSMRPPAHPDALDAWTRRAYGARLIEPGEDVAEEADTTIRDLEDLAREADNAEHRRTRPKLRAYRSTRPGAQALRERLAAAGLDPRALSEHLSAAHIAAFKGYTRFHHLIDDVMDLPRPLALVRLRGKLERHFRWSYLQAELRVLDAKIGGGTATRADRRRAAPLRGKLADIRIPPLERDEIATYRLSALTSLAQAVAAAPSGSPRRDTLRERLGALIGATAERLYEELLVHTNMLAEALDAVPKDAALVLGGS